MTETLYGLLTVANIDVALPLSSLREVVPCPERFDPMPVTSEVFRGAMELRGVVVPVVDIRGMVAGPRPEPSPTDVIVVMKDGQHILGLVADALRGITQVPASQVTAVSSSRNDQLIFGETFVHPEHQSIVSVLNINAILRLPGVPLVEDHLATDAINIAEGQVERSTSAHRHALVRSGSTLLAFGIESVHTLLDDCRPRPSTLTSDLCLGVVEFAGNDVPVLDPLRLFGLGWLPADHTGPALVLKLGDNYVVLALSQLLELRDIDLDTTKRLPPFVTARPDSFVGIAQVGSDMYFVTDHARLMAEPELVSHASVNTTAAVSSASTSTFDASNVQAARDAAAQLTYSIGFEVATPLDQIDDILPMPATIAPTNGESFVMGVISHRGNIIPVISLRSLLGLDPIIASGKACLLLVSSASGQVAIAIDGLIAIDALVWQDPESQSTGDGEAPDLSVALSRAPLINVASHSTLIPLLDLQHFVSALPH